MSCAVLAAALVQAAPACAEEAGAGPAELTNLGEVVVTASRRTETVSKLPFNISAYGGQQLERASVTSIAALTRQVPNFTIQDNGARTAASQVPIIRGLNASQPVVSSARYFQSPVGFYLGNAPLTGSLPLFDVQRIEVLRGPQGTLYGAGSLSGAVRIVPVDPKPGRFEGFVSASGGLISHSGDQDYSVSAAVNIPIGETLALRVNAKHQYEGGFIDLRDVLKRTGNNYVSGAPVLADPADVANSPAVYFDDDDANYAKTTTARAALRWQPIDAFKLDVAYNYTYAKGIGGNIDNNAYAGGPSPLDPRETLRPTGDYERSLPTLEPWNRRSQLATLDGSYDLGFATLSTTLTYGKTKGEVTNDSTQNLLGTPYGVYYTGVPANPRIVIPVTDPDTDRSYTEEVRLVSATGGAFDYVVGAFFQQQKRYIGLYVWAPGADQQSAAAHDGSTTPIALGGTYVPLFANGATYQQDTIQHFKDYSAYAELTWRISENWQVTGGARAFHQTFDQSFSSASSLFLYTVDNDVDSKTSSKIFKLNTSYQIGGGNQVYATWSQGYRRGGANAFALSGPVQEPPQLIEYDSDKTNNFEVGAKGSLFGLYYSADVFYVRWDKPQIDLLTPFILTPVVVNAKEAVSKGFEFEMSGPIGETGFSFSLGLAYAKARLSSDFALPAGDGLGGVVPAAIQGRDGDRLPGAPDWSGALNLAYRSDLGPIGIVTYALGADFRSSTINQLPSISTNTPTRRAPPYGLLNGSITLQHEDWELQLFGTNLADTRTKFTAGYRSNSSYALLGTWGESYSVARPREVGVRVTRRW